MEKLKAKILDLYEKYGAETFRYILTGCTTTFINFAIYTIMTKLFGLEKTDFGVNASNITAIAVSIAFAYFAYKLYVFRRHCPDQRSLIIEMCEFLGARLFSMLIEFLGVALLVNKFGLETLLGKFLTIIVVTIVNYILSKFVVFKKK